MIHVNGDFSCKEVEIEKIITNEYKLSNTREAFEKAIHDKANTLKIMIYPN